MTYLTVEQLSKSYGLKPLFQGITFGLSKGDKTALVAPNGTGKSTLLRVIAGRENPDSGTVIMRKGIRTGYLEQEPHLNDHLTIHETIAQSHSDTVAVIRKLEKATRAQAKSVNDETQRAFDEAMAEMQAANAWGYEQKMQQILGKLNIHELDRSISSLSGGEKKRVALAFVLLESPDVLLLDEPTNHLDVEMIEWLEEYLAKSTTTLLMVTHDRYFLDRVCNQIIEIDGGSLYHHRGNYTCYLQKKSERQEVENVAISKAGQLLKKELEWMRRSPKARTTKSKSRITAFYETGEKAKKQNAGPELRLDTSMKRMGKKILELSGISKRFADIVILNNFSYSFNRGERIGIIGKNGTGKSTFLNVLTGEEPADSGLIDKGSTIVYGHYQQKGIQLNENMRVIDVIRETAEVLTLADGKQISASQFLEHFMFPSKMQYTPVGKLSGGERRRLGLMMVLVKNPNFLILDEPTNDLDLDTLARLEDFLQNYKGCLILVSHDRFFMEKLVDHYFIFEGNGVIRDHGGSCHEYLEEKKQSGAASKKTFEDDKKKLERAAPAEKKKGLTYKQRKEFLRLEKEIAELESEKAALEEQLASGGLVYEELLGKTERYGILEKLIDEKSTKWLDFADNA